MKKFVVWKLVLLITLALLLGWAVKSFYFPISVETPRTEALSPPPAPAKDIIDRQEQQPAPPIYQEEDPKENQFDSQHISTEKTLIPADRSVNLSNRTMSIKKEEKNRLEIMPGVKVKGGGVDISLDKENTSTLELRPNNQNQVMFRQKF